MTKMTASDAAEILLRTIRIETPLQEKAVAMAVAALKKSEADERPAARGHWEIVKGERHMRWRKCSACGAAHDLRYAWPYCPSCGAYMREEAEP